MHRHGGQHTPPFPHKETRKHALARIISYCISAAVLLAVCGGIAAANTAPAHEARAAPAAPGMNAFADILFICLAPAALGLMLLQTMALWRAQTPRRRR